MAPRVVVFNNMITPYTNRLYNELASRGLDLAVLSCTPQEADRSWAGSFTPRYITRTVPGVSIPLSRSRHTHVNIGVGRALHALAPDLLFVNGLYPSMLAGAAWARANGKALALTIDGWRETMPNTAYHRLARPWLLRQCDAVVCCSDKGRAYFRGEGVRADDLFVVPLVPAWDPPAVVPAFDDRPFHLLWCARLNDGAKNAIFFENVAIALGRIVPGLKVRVVGSGAAERRMLARFGGAGIDVSHDRYLPWQAISDVFLQSRLLLLPSLLEPWGLVCNEALQCGVPCLVSPHVGAGGELVRDHDNGYVCALDEQVWVDAARGLLEHPAHWEAMSRQARQSVRRDALADAAARFAAAVDHLLRAPARQEAVQ
ncbi:glycosyltransferase involved in cell wall biosynthesis [Bradyrhizobium sp. USDA 4532]|uniref:glycosyltransferase family 4 protein n=1 Tax=unclassified Bradyrhizobium TaxID=2631580 RepID=UPI00209E2C44|nr:MULTISPECIES: glycosyltransferase family 4 protein [unclassified Bradyrhizobium]MCP1834462.1 glycosyltransferase involved in cell wall biosynthesis [Bradyrhizobium sp. USDA 4545]MCP1919207.1 glycosyltransferase involved in cell wall biosynthesis [Bradyrhizobium sp. USDA 4532]